MANEFGALLRRLREQRGLPISELSSRSGVSTSTIQRWETSGHQQARRSNIRAVFETLERLSPLSEEESDEFCRLTGLQGIVSTARQAMSAFSDKATAPLHQSPVGKGLSAEEAQCYRWLAALLNHLDAKRLLASLEATAAVAGVPTPEEPRLDRSQIALRVAHPPQRLPNGAIEQRFTYYTADGRELTPVPPRHPGVRRAQ